MTACMCTNLIVTAHIVSSSDAALQWSLQIKDTLGAGLLSGIQELSLGGIPSIIKSFLYVPKQCDLTEIQLSSCSS